MAFDGTLKFDTSIDTSGFQSGASGLGEIAKNALSVFTGNLMTEAAGKISELGQLAMQSGMEFEASMAKAKTLFSGTEQEFGNLSNEILKLSSSSGLAASGLAEAAYSAESASVPAEQLGTMLEQSSKLAAAGFTDVDTALSATAKTMNAYGMTGEESIGKVQKVLMQTQNLGITTVGQLGASLAQVTPTAAAFGVSFDQVGASLAAMTAQGTPTAQATTQLNALIAELGKSGTTASKNLTKAAEGTKYAGMSFSEMMDSGADLGTILGMISDQAEKDGLSMVDMFSSIEAGKGALSIFTNEGAVFRKDLEQMATSADVVGEAYETVSDTLEFKTQQMKTSLQNLATVAQQAVAKDMKDAVDVGTQAINRMQTALQEGGFSGLAQEAITIGGELITKLASGIMDGMPKVTEAAVGIMQNLASGIRTNLPGLIPIAMNALVTFSEGLRSNVGKLVDAGLDMIMALADSLIQNIPVFVQTVPTIITNLAGLINDNAPKLLSCGVQLIGKLVGGIISALPVIVQNIPKIIQAIVSVLMAFNWLNLGKTIITAISNGVKALSTALPQALKNIAQTAKDWLSTMNWATLGSDIIDLIVIGVQSLATAIPTALQTIGQTAVEFIKGIDWLSVGSFLIEGIISGVSSLTEAAVSAIKGVGEAILNGFKSLFGIASPSTVMEEQGNFLIQGLTNALANMPSAIGECLSGALTKVTEWGTNLAQSGLTAAGDFLNNVGSKIGEVPGKIGGFLGTAYSSVTSWGTNTVNKAKDSASKTLSNIQSNFSQIPGKVGSQLTNAVSKVTTWSTNTVNTVRTAATSVLTTIQTNFSQLPGKIGTQLTSALTRLTTWGASVVRNSRTYATNAVNGAKAAFSALPGGLQTYLSSALGKVAAWGGQMASSGRSAAQACVSAVKNTVSGLPGAMHDIGNNIASGLANGIRAGISWVTDAARDIANRALNAAKSALGINSPSKVFEREVGTFIPPGIGRGIVRAMPAMERETSREMKGMAERMKNVVNEEMSAKVGTVRMKAGFGNGPDFDDVPGGGNVYQTININQPVKTPSETARAIRLEQQYGLAGD